ncbi:MAG: aminotransferase class I/II-fold pyridoxal phosphate-dependent enzyme [Thermomicrobiales bacterium]
MKIERFDLERWMTTWELDVDCDIAESGILPLSLGDVYDLLGEDQAATLERQVRETPLGYSEARGTIALRTTLANTYANATPDDILVTTGAIEANFLLFNALLQEGDHVVAVSPAYQQLHSVPRAIGCDVDLWSVQTDNGFAYDLNRLESLVRDNTKLIVLNTPHNPTGAMLDESELREIVAIADRVGAWILSDEAYRWLEHPGGEKLPPPLRDLTDRAISVGTVSKPFGVPGLRIGWFAATAEIAQKCWGLRDYTSLSPANLSDIIATAIIAGRDRILPRNGAIIEENMAFARTWFAEHADLASWSEPRAGLLAMMKVHLPIDSQTLADGLARDARVMLAPGSSFGLEGYLRIGVGQRPDIFAEGLRRTAAYLNAIREESASAASA